MTIGATKKLSLEGSSVAAAFLLSMPRQRDFRHLDDPIVQVHALKNQPADFAAIVRSRATGAYELLGTSDDFSGLIRLCSQLASQDIEVAADGTKRIIPSSEIRAGFRKLETLDLPLELSQPQKACLDVYAGGEYAGLVETASQSARLFDKALRATGDTFLIYLMRELDPREDCDSTIIGQERIAAAIADLNRILSAVPDETTAPTP